MLHAAVLFQGLRVLGDSALVISPKGETTLTKQEGGYPLLPAFLGSSGEPFWGPQESLEAPMKTGPSQLSLWTEATLGPTHLGVECVYECACVCSRACARVQPVCPHILDLGGGVRVLRRATHSPWLLELREFSFKPATLMLGHPPPSPRPTGGDDVCSLVARAVPKRRLLFIDRSRGSDVSSRTLATLLPRRRLPPPHLPARGGGGSEIKAAEERIGAMLGLRKGGDSDLPSLSWSPGVYK